MISGRYLSLCPILSYGLSDNNCAAPHSFTLSNLYIIERAGISSKHNATSKVLKSTASNLLKPNHGAQPLLHEWILNYFLHSQHIILLWWQDPCCTGRDRFPYQNRTFLYYTHYNRCIRKTYCVRRQFRCIHLMVASVVDVSVWITNYSVLTTRSVAADGSETRQFCIFISVLHVSFSEQRGCVIVWSISAQGYLNL